MDKTKWILNAYLEQNKYDLFIETITKLNINKENYVEYLNIITEVLKSKFEMQDAFEVTSYDKLEEVYGIRKKEKTFIEWLPDIKNAIVLIFKKKLDVSNSKYEDSELKEVELRLENFKERFM